MSNRVVTALRAERDNLLDVCRSLTPEEWAAPSECAGWRVQDLVAHVGSLAHASITRGH